MTHSSLLVVGSVALDDIDGPFGRHPDILGGSASFAATAASFFTLGKGAVKLLAVVGDDFPAAHVEFLQGRGVELSGLERVTGKTFRWSGRYSDDLTARTTLDTQLGVFAGFQPKLGDAHRACDFLFLGNIDPTLQIGVLEQCRRPKLVACDTIQLWIEHKPDELRRMLGRVDLLIVNDEEARMIAGVHNVVKAATAIRALGPKGVVVKRGDSGAVLFYEGGVFAAPAYPLEEVRDPTGAGDTFAGGFMGYLTRAGDVTPDSIKHAMIYGSVLASYCVEDFSLDRMRTLQLKEIAQRYRAFYELTHFEHIAL